MTSPIQPGEPVGFIGTGVMGRSMAGHLLRAGHPLVVHTRSREKAAPLLAEGAEWAGSPAEVARRAAVVFTMVGFPHDVHEIYLGAEGLVAHGRPGAILCDCTTSSPELAARIAETARARGLSAIDAPVSGGDVGAREARLSIMCGGSPEAFERIRPLLERLGTNVVRQGGPGAGQHAKMCNQIAIAGGMMGVCEALLYASASGLAPETVLRSISAGAAGSWSLSNLAPRILRRDFDPGFYVAHFLKDMDIALEEAQRLGVPTPGLRAARALYQKVADLGGARLGTQALYLAYEAMR